MIAISQLPREIEQVASIVIRPVRDRQELDEVHKLTYEAYLSRGYCAPQVSGRLVHYPHLDDISETTVLIALDKERIVGTNSITLDGPSGLHIDEDFKTICDQVRQERRVLASSWRIATRGECHNERKVVLSLMKETLAHALRKGVETCLFTFNPRHELFYQRIMNMRTIARKDGSVNGLSNAPAVLMRIDREMIPRQWRRPFPEERFALADAPALEAQ